MAEREIKTTLALDGEKQFKAAMDEAYRGMKVLGSEMKLNTAIFGDNEKSVEGLTKKGEILRKEIAQQKEIVAALSKAVEESATAYGETDKRTDAYRIKLNNAQVALNNMEGELKNNDTAIANWGKSAQDAEKKTVNWRGALENLNKGLQSGIDALKPVAAGIAAVGASAVAAGKQIFDATVETGKYADGLITLSNQTGVSIQTLQEWQYAAQFIDTEVDTMTGSMAKMIKQMDAAREGTGASAEAFSALGVKITDSSGQLLNSQTVFFAAIDALGKVANETERDALAMQIFGKSAQELNPLIIAGSAELQRLGLEAQNAGIIMSDQTVTAFGAFDDSMNTLNSTIAGVKNSFLAALLPAIQSVIPVVQDVALKFGDWLRSDGAQALILSLGDKIKSVASWISENLTAAVNGAINVFQTITSTIGWVIDNFDTLATVGGVVIGMMTALKVAQIAVNIAMAANPIGIIIVAIAALVAAIVVLIKNWDSVKQAITKVWDSIKNAVAAGVEAIKNAFSAVINWFGGLVSGVFQAGVNIVKGIWEGIKSATTWLWNKIKGWIDDALGWIADLLGIHSPSSVMRDMIGKPMVQGMAEGITKNAGLVDNAMASILPDTKSAALALDVTRRFNDVASDAMTVRRESRQTVELSDAALDRLAAKLGRQIERMPTPVIEYDGREVARMNRKVALA